MRSAYGANIVCLEPGHHALMVECVSHVAPQRRDLVALLEVHQAHDAIIYAPEPTFVISGFGCELNDTLSGLIETVLFGTMDSDLVDNAGAKDG